MLRTHWMFAFEAPDMSLVHDEPGRNESGFLQFCVKNRSKTINKLDRPGCFLCIDIRWKCRFSRFHLIPFWYLLHLTHQFGVMQNNVPGTETKCCAKTTAQLSEFTFCFWHGNSCLFENIPVLFTKTWQKQPTEDSFQTMRRKERKMTCSFVARVSDVFLRTLALELFFVCSWLAEEHNPPFLSWQVPSLISLIRTDWALVFWSPFDLGNSIDLPSYLHLLLHNQFFTTLDFTWEL